MGRAELFPVSRSIRDQVTLAVGDLVTLVVEIASHFQKSVTDMKSGSVAIDIHNTFSELIESFQARCEDVAELMWQHQVSQEGLGHQGMLVQLTCQGLKLIMYSDRCQDAQRVAPARGYRPRAHHQVYLAVRSGPRRIDMSMGCTASDSIHERRPENTGHYWQARLGEVHPGNSDQ